MDSRGHLHEGHGDGIAGAIITGGLAVLVALGDNGLTTAALTLALIVVVQQVEGFVLQPLLMGSMVRLHPVAVILAVTIGSLLAGIAGAVLATPLTAAATGARSRLRSDPSPG